MKTEPLHAVEVTRCIRDRIYEETKGLEADELLQYFKERSESASRKVEERDRSQVSGPSGTTLR